MRGAQMKHINNRIRNPNLKRIHPELSFLDREIPKKPKKMYVFF